MLKKCYFCKGKVEGQRVTIDILKLEANAVV